MTKCGRDKIDTVAYQYRQEASSLVLTRKGEDLTSGYEEEMASGEGVGTQIYELLEKQNQWNVSRTQWVVWGEGGKSQSERKGEKLECFLYL